MLAPFQHDPAALLNLSGEITAFVRLFDQVVERLGVRHFRLQKFCSDQISSGHSFCEHLARPRLRPGPEFFIAFRNLPSPWVPEDRPWAHYRPRGSSHH